jgi:hypothetical protein
MIQQPQISDPAAASRSSVDAKVDAAIETLRAIDPAGPHCLCAIDPNSGAIDGITIAADDLVTTGRVWVGARIRSQNLYFTVNRPREGFTGTKPSDADISHFVGLFLDIDPVKWEEGGPDTPKEHYAKEWQRLTGVKLELADSACPPTLVTDTGAGVQAMWLFDSPLPSEKAEWVRKMNYGLKKRFGGDSTFDLSRLARLPFTANFPNERKRKLGRTSALSSLDFQRCSQKRYTTEQLAAWSPPVTPPAQGAEISFAGLDMEAVREIVVYEDIPEATRIKFEDECGHRSKLKDLWNGIPLPKQDTSGSGFTFALARLLKPTGQFTISEYGQLLAAWEHRSAKDLTAREITRAWSKIHDAGDGFPPTDIDESRERPGHGSNTADVAGKTVARALATRWVPVDPATLPRREWVIQDVAAKRNVTLLAGPPGVSKSTLTIELALATITGRSDICGIPISRRSSVWVWNQEDDISELQRRFAAVMQAFNISDADLCDERGNCMLFLNSGTERPLFLATRHERSLVRAPSVKQAIADIKENSIGLVVLDPLVEMHQANENDNAEMREVLGIARSIAVDGQCNVFINAHTRKPDKASSKSYAGDMDSLRGGSSQPGVSRVMFTLYTASSADAKQWHMEGSHLDYVRLDMAKTNLSAPWKEPRWFRRESVVVGGLDGDSVGILRPVTLRPITGPGSRVDLLSVLAGALGRLEKPGEIHSIEAVFQAMPAAEQRLFPETKHRARAIRTAFDGATEYATDHGKLTLVSRRGRGGLGFQLIPQIPQNGIGELLGD